MYHKYILPLSAFVLHGETKLCVFISKLRLQMALFSSCSARELGLNSVLRH